MKSPRHVRAPSTRAQVAMKEADAAAARSDAARAAGIASGKARAEKNAKAAARAAKAREAGRRGGKKTAKETRDSKSRDDHTSTQRLSLEDVIRAGDQ